MPDERDVYDSVLEAQEAAVAAVAPGVTAGEVDEAARSVLRRAKLDRVLHPLDRARSWAWRFMKGRGLQRSRRRCWSREW